MLALADDLLDSLFWVSYTHLGYHLRQLLLWPAGELDRDLTGRVCLVTGANAGLGFAAARGLAERGATVLLGCRDPERGEKARGEIAEAAGKARVAVEVVDLSDLSSVRACAERVLARESRLDLLVNNAGVLLPERRMSADGIELTFATNVLGGFLITQLLGPLLARTGAERGEPAQVMNVSSGGMYGRQLDASDLRSEREPFDGVAAYAQTKRAQVILSEMWAERFAAREVTFAAMHPGWVDTPGLAESLPFFQRWLRPLLRSADQGADTILWLALADEPAHATGKFWFDRRARSPYGLLSPRESDETRAKLWAECERLCAP